MKDKYNTIVKKVNDLSDHYKNKTNDELKEMTKKFQTDLANGKSLDDIQADAFAVAREVSERVLGLRPYDVQVYGGAVLHDGRIAEMKTGEGKTLTAAMPVYLNALTGKGVHVVTVNDYLAKRDKEHIGQVFEFLGLTVGLVLESQAPSDKRKAYNADVTYSTNSNIGFDYLRDNSKALRPLDKVQREFNFIILDEVDSILIDEARTPLILSNQTSMSSKEFIRADQFVRELKPDDYHYVPKNKQTVLTESGIKKAEEHFKVDNIYDGKHGTQLQLIQQALNAHVTYHKDEDYIVNRGKVMLVDSFTGRTQENRRFQDGLHQAIEAKEGVDIQPDSQTMTSITYQNLFLMYDKISGMTGTAKTEEKEFKEIYNMRVEPVSTNRPNIRVDQPDSIFYTKDEKIAVIVEEVIRRHKTGQPVLIGTVDIVDTERISKALNKVGIKHNVLNAINHEKEADIIAEAGQKGAVTVSTNMAGRGTDIMLGEGVAKLGGLFIIGTERHESARIDNQLRGRAGRQGDPGESKFYVSFEDELVKVYGVMNNLLEGRTPSQIKTYIDSPSAQKEMDNCQARAEAINFERRKNTFDYDKAINEQRVLVYKQRDILLFMEEEDVIKAFDNIRNEYYNKLRDDKVFENEDKRSEFIDRHFSEDFQEEYDIRGTLKTVEDFKKFNESRIETTKNKLGKTNYYRQIRRYMIVLSDEYWRIHVETMEQLKGFIGLQAMSQKDPTTMFQEEAYRLFNKMTDNYKRDLTLYASSIKRTGGR